MYNNELFKNALFNKVLFNKTFFNNALFNTAFLQQSILQQSIAPFNQSLWPSNKRSVRQIIDLTDLYFYVALPPVAGPIGGTRETRPPTPKKFGAGGAQLL